jgi:hypothetical protein
MAGGDESILPPHTAD